MRCLPGFYALEGLDGAGTTTQARLLEHAAATEKLDLFVTSEPTGNPLGQLIRSILGGTISVEPGTLAHLFAADRFEHLHESENGIIDRIGRGQTVVTDRYLFSSLAYQGLDSDFEFVSDLNAAFPLPRALFFLEVTTDTAIERSADREHLEIFEHREFQNALHDSYDRALEWGASRGMAVQRIDGALPAEEIHRKIWSEIRSRPIS